MYIIPDTAVPGRFNLAGQVPSGKVRRIAAPGPPGGSGLGDRPITLPCKTPHIAEFVSTFQGLYGTEKRLAG